MKTKRSSHRAVTWPVVFACVIWLSDDLTFAVATGNETGAGEQTTQVQINDVDTLTQPTAETNRALYFRGPGARNREAIVVLGRDVMLKGEESAEAVVVIGGSAMLTGKVHEAVVAIGGDVIVQGEVGEAVVAILGNVELGTNASVAKNVVAVIGNVNVGNRAIVGGEIVAVGGKLDIADGAQIHGPIQEVDFSKVGLPNLVWLQTWVKQCVFKLRPLALQVGWVWVIWGMFLVLYLLVAVAFPRPVAACVEELMHRPATTFAIGLLTKLLLPFVLFLLLVTGIGVFVIPFIWIALMLAGIVGKVALLEYFGKQLGRGTGLAVLGKPVLALLVGAIIITLLYMVPILGLIMFGLTGMWALGAAILAMVSGLRRETAPRQAWLAAPAVPYPPHTAAGVQAAEMAGVHPGQPAAPAVAGPVQFQPAQTQPGTVAPGVPSVWPPAGQTAQAVIEPAQAAVPEAFQYPRAGFWERLGAALLDVVLVGVISGIAGAGMFWWLIALAYFAGMWTWRGTTIGGVLLNLKVVRFDGKPVTFPVALVRALAGAFSVIVFCLGFLWIAWDREKQAWHDKIVGTVVVRLPRSQPLLSV